VASIKPRDYEPAGTVEAASPYAAFFALRQSADALEVGDVLESDGGLRILKFVGFEEAQWMIPEAKPPASVGETPEAGSRPLSQQGAIQ
jgi:hypothetical protein